LILLLISLDLMGPKVLKKTTSLELSQGKDSPLMGSV